MFSGALELCSSTDFALESNKLRSYSAWAIVSIAAGWTNGHPGFYCYFFTAAWQSPGLHYCNTTQQARIQLNQAVYHSDHLIIVSRIWESAWSGKTCPPLLTCMHWHICPVQCTGSCIIWVTNVSITHMISSTVSAELAKHLSKLGVSGLPNKISPPQNFLTADEGFAPITGGGTRPQICRT